MKKQLMVLVSLVLAFAGFGLGGVKSELESNEDDIPKLTQADLNCVWFESKGSQTLGYNTLKIVNAYVGQTLTETLEIRNKTREALDYSIFSELMDCENKEVWQDGDRLALKLSSDKVSLKAEEKKQVPVTIQVQKNHSGNAYFRIYFTPSKGKREFVSLNICQFDTKVEIMITKPPAMFKTLTEALKNKTKLGRLIRKPDKTFLIYGNIHLFCFDTKSGKFAWHYNNKVSIIDLWIYGNYIFIQNLEKITIANGKLCLHKGYGLEFPKDDFVCRSYNILLGGMANIELVYPDEYVCWERHLCFKANIGSAISWLEKGRNELFGILPNRPDVVWITDMGCEASPGELSAFDLLLGRQHCNSGPYYILSNKKEHNVIIFDFPYGALTVIDTQSLKRIFQINRSIGGERVVNVSDTGSAIIYADCKQCGAYDNKNKKLLWKIAGDGYPLMPPKLDDAKSSVYILDEDSTWNPDYTKKRDAQYLRLYKFDVVTGKQYWKAMLFKIPKDSHNIGKCIIELKGEKVVVSYYMYDSDSNEKSYTFTVRQTDGKPSK